MMAWKLRKLDQLGTVGRGKSRHRPRNAPELYGGDYPFFQTGDVKAAEFYLRAYSQTYNEVGLAQSKYWQKGTLCITIAANIAETAILDTGGCFPDSVVGFVADPDECDARFIKYYIDYIKLEMQNVSRGTTQDNLNLEKLLSFDFLVPPLEIQKKILGILISMEDRLDNVKQKISHFEEIAQNLYQECFVKFRFSEGKNTNLVDLNNGNIPFGWVEQPLDYFCNIIKEKFNDDYAQLPLIELKKMPQYTLLAGDMGDPDELSSSRIIFDENDILFGSIRPYLHKVIIAPCQGVTNTSVFVIRATEERFQAMLTTLLSSKDTVQWAPQHSGGTKMPVIKWDLFSKMPVIRPDNETLQKFQELVWPIMEIIKLETKRVRTLQEMRNLLLPKLISGELDVSELDIEVTE